MKLYEIVFWEQKQDWLLEYYVHNTINSIKKERI